MKDRMRRYALPISAIVFAPLGWSTGAAMGANGIASSAAATGRAVYTNCSACHGAVGQGSLGPALKGNPRIADADYVIGLILSGIGPMPPFRAQLSDSEIADVATFIRTNWGNRYVEVNKSQVARVRAGARGAPAM